MAARFRYSNRTSILALYRIGVTAAAIATDTLALNFHPQPVAGRVCKILLQAQIPLRRLERGVA